jgi:hypothetical protein
VNGTSEREHDEGCPRLQFWDAGESECPCTCEWHDASESDEATAPDAGQTEE